MLGLIVSLMFLQTPPVATPAKQEAVASPVAAKPAATTVEPAKAQTVPADVKPAVTTDAPAATVPVVTTIPGQAPAAGGAVKPEASPFIQYLPLVMVGGLAYFMLFRPQKNEEKKRKELLNRMQKNDKVITAGGMYGTIVGVDAESDTVTVRLGSDPGVKVEFTKASIVRVISPADKKDSV